MADINLYKLQTDDSYNIDTSEIDKYLKLYDLENIFHIYQDQYGNYKYNLNTGVYLKLNPSYIKEYTVKSNLQWSLISYDIYNTTRLAWLLMKINDIKAGDIFKNRQPGEKIKYIVTDIVKQIIDSLNETVES